MTQKLTGLLLLGILLPGFMMPVAAQDSSSDSADESSEQTEESEEAYRRRMELEGREKKDPAEPTHRK